MFRILWSIAFVILAFAAGVQFERADARTTCAGLEDWGPYLTCAAREVLEEVIS